MNNFFIKIDNFFYKGNILFYKKPVDNDLHKAKDFNDKYMYYFDKKQNGQLKTLGKFIRKSKRLSNGFYNDYDYDVYEFEKETINCDESEYIFCCAIHESDENMILVPELSYFDYSVYYNKN